MGHNPASVTFTPRATPSAVVYTERSAPAAVVYTERSTSASTWLEPLTARKRSDGFWLFLSGLANGTMFTKNDDDWQLFLSADAFGNVQRMGKRAEDGFVLLLEDNT
jgi:hypothetical protein